MADGLATFLANISKAVEKAKCEKPLNKEKQKTAVLGIRG